MRGDGSTWLRPRLTWEKTVTPDAGDGQSDGEAAMTLTPGRLGGGSYGYRLGCLGLTLTASLHLVACRSVQATSLK